MSFGEPDEIPTNPKSVTSSSVTWMWREGRNVTSAAAPYIGYKLSLKVDGQWIEKTTVPFRASLDRWQEGTVTDLEPNTYYLFDITVYRKYTDGTIFRSTFTAKGYSSGLNATTLPGSQHSTCLIYM